MSTLRGAQIILGLVMTYFLAHNLSVTQYGEYQFLLNVIGILGILCFTEFGNTLLQSVARGHDGSFRKMLPYTFIGGLVGSIVLAGFAVWFEFIRPHPALALGFLIAACFFPFQHGLMLWKGFKVGQERFAVFTKIEILSLLITNIMIIAVTIFIAGQYDGAVFFFTSIPAIVNLIMTVRILRAIKPAAKAEQGIIPHGVKSSLYAALFRASVYLDKILLFAFMTPAAVALFVAADRVSDLLRTALTDGAIVLAPKFAKTKTYTHQLDRFFKIFTALFGLGMIVFAFTFLPYLIILIYGENYQGAVPYAQALIIGQAIGNLSSLQFRYIRSKLDTDNYRKIVLFTSLYRVAASFCLIPLLGILGAVISSVTYKIVLSITTNYIIKKYYRNMSGGAY